MLRFFVVSPPPQGYRKREACPVNVESIFTISLQGLKYIENGLRVNIR
jgi:hypothetical protein